MKSVTKEQILDAMAEVGVDGYCPDSVRVMDRLFPAEWEDITKECICKNVHDGVAMYHPPTGRFLFTIKNWSADSAKSDKPNLSAYRENSICYLVKIENGKIYKHVS